MATRTAPHDPAPDALPPPPILDPGRDALFLDLDGTLAPIRPHPSQVELDRRTLDLLARLSRAFAGRVAVVSGRELADVDRLTGGSVAAVAGVHGLDRRNGARRSRAEPAPGVARAVERFRAFGADAPGTLVEDKGLSAALHYRQAPDRAEAAQALARALAAEHGLALQTGKMVVELRTPGADKGAALAAFMAEAPFAGSRAWFVGDDDTDEAGFRAAAAHGGAGVLVGPPKPTAARHRLPDVGAVADWLAACLDGGAGR